MKKKLLYPNLRAELARKGLNVLALSEYMGMTTQNVYNKLNGKVTFTQKDMKTIQDFFKVNGGDYTLDYLFSDVD